MNLKSLILRFVRHELISGTFYIFIGSIIANFLAFLLNLFFARSLSYADYGIYASLLSVIVLTSIPAGSINTILVRFSSDYYSKNEIGKLKSFYKKAIKYIFAFSLLILLFFAVFSLPITSFLHLDNVFYVIIAGFCVLIGYLQILNTGFLQGLMKFGFLSFVSAISGFIKFIAGVMLVWLGFRAFSGFGALIFMGLSIFIVGFIPLRSIFSQKTESDVHISTKEIVRYALPVFTIILFMTSFTYADVILVKHFFSPHQAGLYAGLSLIGKVIFYFTIPIPLVMFPLLIRRYNQGHNFNSLFYLALFLVLVPSVAITGFYFLFPKFVINFFLAGRDYQEIAGYAGLFGIFLTTYSLINVFVNFFLSLSKTKIAFLVVLGSLTQIVLISTFHSNFYQVILSSMVVSIALLASLFVYYLKLFVRPVRRFTQ